MKKFYSIALVLVLTVAVLTGCRSNSPADTSSATTSAPTRPSTAATSAPTTMPTTMPTTQATQPSTDMTGPDMEGLIPGTDDTIDPTNGANQDATGVGTIH